MKPQREEIEEFSRRSNNVYHMALNLLGDSSSINRLKTQDDP